MGKQGRYGWTVAAWLALAGTAYAQHAPLEGISESTDPQKVAEVEARARDIIQRQQQQTSGASGTSSSSSDRAAAPNRYEEPGKNRMNRGHRPEKAPASRESDMPKQR